MMKNPTPHELLLISMEVIKAQGQLIVSLKSELNESSKKLVIARKELLAYQKKWLYLKKNKKLYRGGPPDTQSRPAGARKYP